MVLTDVDKVAASGLRGGGGRLGSVSELSVRGDLVTVRRLLKEEEGEENVEIVREDDEWVPAGLVDVYVTEKGSLDVGDVGRIAQELGELEEYIFERTKS